MTKKCHHHRLHANPAWYHQEGTESRHSPSSYRTIQVYIQVSFPFNVNKLRSDKTKICLDIGPALLVSKV